ncbi:MAG: arsenate reductase ArsC [Vibrionaceae bacterium]|nr:arsenate reductase ArsC [Vibrionaceae bacterium]
MKLLFVCRHNSCRSILAEAVAQRVLPNNYEIRSAGSEPTGEIQPQVIEFLKSIEVDTGTFRSKSWEEFIGFHPDFVISVCDTVHHEACPNWLGDGVRVNWSLDNPLADESASAKGALQDTYQILRERLVKLADLPLTQMSHEEQKTVLTQLGTE